MSLNLKESINQHIVAANDLLADEALLERARQVIDLSVQTFRSGGKIMLCGNGGSSSDAEHLAGELAVRLCFDRPALAAISLGVAPSVMTATANDYSYDYVFARQVEALGRAGDMLWAFSTSGNSANILRAIAAAKQRGIFVVGFSGAGGGKMAGECDILLNFPSNNTPNIQELYMVLGHAICAEIEQVMFAA